MVVGILCVDALMRFSDPAVYIDHGFLLNQLLIGL